MAGKTLYIGIAVIVILAIIAAAIVGINRAAAAPAGKSLVALQLTDPPQAPNGTSALVATYSSMQIHVVSKNGSSGWVYLNGSGSVNLMSLVNVSQVIGKAEVNSSSTIDMARFNMTSASITINGTTYPVSVPSPQITVKVVQNSSLNSTAGVLVDLTPTVVVIYTSNSTVFVMVPSVRAVVVPGIGASVASSVGAKELVKAAEHASLDAQSPSISITNASLSVSGNVARLSVTVKDDSNSSVVIKHVMLFGNETFSVSANAVASGDPHSEGSGSANSSLNISVNTSANVPLTSHEVEVETGIGQRLQHFKTLNFIISQNGTLSLPASEGEVESSDAGVSIQAGQSMTLAFDGQISLANGGISVVPIAGGQYTITVNGEEDSHASANVTAG